MILRCRVESDNWIAIQLEEMVKGKLKIIPIEETRELIDVPTPVGQQVWSDRWSFKDNRESAPFHQILPCPQCGVPEDKNHDPLKHIDPSLGHICGQGNCPEWCKS